MIRLARIATGGWVALAFLGLVAVDWFGGVIWGTAILFVVGSVVALREVFAMLRGAGALAYERWASFALGSSLLLRVCEEPLRLSGREARELSLAVLALGFVGPLMAEVARARGEVTEPRPEVARRLAATCFGLGYVGLLATFLLELRMIPGPGFPNGGGPHQLGLEMALLLVACVKIGDTMAYFVGRTVGRTPLCPVSPKKTWEGTIASAVASVMTALALGSILGHDWRILAGFGLVVDLAGQGGDLIESYLKRILGAKDSARTFGEMGGVLDMADAVLLAAPAAYLWTELLIVRG